MHFTLSDLLMDIAQNSIESGAAHIEIVIKEKSEGSAENPEFRFSISDNGKGMDPEELERVKDPFVSDGIKHPNRKIGLGLPFLIQTAENSGGGCEIKSEKGNGTEVSAWFDLKNIDTPPIGDLCGAFRTILLFEGQHDVSIYRLKEAGENSIKYDLQKSELEDALGGFEDTQSLILLNDYLYSIEEDDEDKEEDS